MKLPIQRVPGTTPPKFRYKQTVDLPAGGTQVVQHEGCVSSSMETALCDLLRIAEQLAAENEKLKVLPRK